MKYKLFDSYIIRVPLTSFQYIDSIKTEDDILRKLLSDSDLKEAIYIANPLLFREIEKLILRKMNDQKKVKRIFQTCLRYFTRMSIRCTPFGLFAGCAIVRSGMESKIRVKKLFQRATHLDICYLYQLSNLILNNLIINDKIAYYPNNSLLRIDDRYRYYIENKIVNNQIYYQILGVKYTSYLKKILKKSKHGLTVFELIKLLVDDGVDESEAANYIQGLINLQILQNELTLSVIGLDYFMHLINLLKKVQGKSSVLQNLEEIQYNLWQLDNELHGVKLYKNIIDKLKLFDIPIEVRSLFHVDMIKKTQVATFSDRIAKELESAIIFLNKITPVTINPILAQFKEDFYSRYQEQEIPLMEALDMEIGLGYPSKSTDAVVFPLIDEFDLPQQLILTKENIDIKPLNSLLLQKIFECIVRKGEEIILTDEDIVGLTANWEDIPPTFSCMFEILQDDNEGTLINFKSASGNGANLLTRFARIDEEIENLVKTITSKEQELMSDVILAEVVHLSKARECNILCRPHIRDYELLYMANSDLPAEKVIQVSDLMLSVYRGRLVIRSKSLNKEIVPRLTSAYNFNNNQLPIIRFLCDMQLQNQRKEFYFNWGSIVEKMPFLPRIRYQNTILSEAKWQIKVSDVEQKFEITDDVLLIEEFDRWREIIFLPDKTVYSEGNNRLFVNWKSPLMVRSLFSMIKKKNEFVLEKFPFNPKTAIVKGEDGDYTNECIAIFYKNMEYE